MHVGVDESWQQVSAFGVIDWLDIGYEPIGDSDIGGKDAPIVEIDESSGNDLRRCGHG
jgi:hypothetical protein